FWVFLGVSIALIAFAPWLMRILAPGLDREALETSIQILRILALSTASGGVAAVYWALLYTERRFGPTAFYQATLNLCTVVAALVLWTQVGVFAFPIGYAAGACVQLAIVHLAARPSLHTAVLPRCTTRWRDI